MRISILPVLCLAAILFISLPSELYSQTKAVAEAGAKEITISEFKDRYEFTPWNKDIRSAPADKLKEEFLYTLIAEKLFAQKASQLGYDTTIAFKTKMKVLHKMYARDMLYREEILKHVKVSDEDVKSFYYKAHTKLTGKFISSTSEAVINESYNKLKSGISFDSLYRKSSPGDIQDTLIITFGKFSEQTEDMLYSLKQGEYSKPFLFNNNWFIVIITDVLPVNPKSQREEGIILSNVKKVLTARRSEIYYNNYLDKFLADKKTNVNGKLYQELAETIIKIVQSKDTSASRGLYLNENDFEQIRYELGEKKLNASICRSGDKDSGLSAFLDEMYYDDVRFPSSEPEVIKQVLSGKLISFMCNELLADEAFRRGLHLTEEVKNQLEIWMNNYLYSQLRAEILNSVKISDEEVKDYYNKKNNYRSSVRVKITEAVTDNLDDINVMLDDLNAGVNFKDAAKKISKPWLMRFRNIESGFIPADSLGETGRIATEMKPGEIYGPLKADSLYIVFQLIDKKQDTYKDIIPFDNVKESLRKSLVGLRSYHALLDYTVKLADEYRVSVNEEVLKSIEVTNVYSVMFRYMGFGGKILAAPLINPYSEWVKQWKEAKKEIQ